MGMTLTAKHRAMRYSLSSTLVKSKALAMNGTSQTRVVAIRLPRAAQLRVLFMLCSVKMLPRCERMLKLWKISAMLMVTKAMVVPSGLSAISQTPDSM